MDIFEHRDLRSLKTYADTQSLSDTVVCFVDTNHNNNAEDILSLGEKILIQFAILYVIETKKSPMLDDVCDFLCFFSIDAMRDITNSLADDSLAVRAWRIFENCPKNTQGNIKLKCAVIADKLYERLNEGKQMLRFCAG